MSNKIELKKERIYKIFEAGVSFGHHNAGDFNGMANAFKTILEEMLAEQIEEQIEEQMDENKDGPGWVCIIKCPKKPKDNEV